MKYIEHFSLTISHWAHRSWRVLLLFAIFNCQLSIVNSVKAQQENAAFYIYQNDGHFDGFFYDEVEKISYSFLDTLGIEHNEIVSQEIVTADSTYRIMLSAIDSVGFVQPEVKFNPHLYIVGGNPEDPRYYDPDNVFYLDYGEDGEILVFSQWLDQFSWIPKPQVGDVFVNIDPKYGWSTKIVSLTREYPGYEGNIVANCKPIDDITDIFQQFVTIEEYSYNDDGCLARRRVSGCPELTVGRFPRKAEGKWEGDIFNFSISGHVPLYYSDDMTVTIDPSIEGKLHLKTAWNLSWLGDKYISIHSKLNFGVGVGLTVDGKIKDFFPGGVGGLVGGVPIPATCPIIMLDITPDAFLRGEAHVNFRLNSPKLNGAMWTRLEINNWVPSLTMGFGNSDDGSNFESVDDSGSKATMSLNGFVQAGMLFPMKFKSLPVLKKLFDSEIGGQWFVGPKIAADFTLDLTTMPWNDTAAYTQLKNITAQLHMLDADFEVKGTVKTAFSGKKEVTLADGSTSIFPPFDASFVPEFSDPEDYETKILYGDEMRNARVIAFKPSGYVIKPVDVGVALFDVKDDNTIDYNDEYSHEQGNRRIVMYYHFAQLFGQELDKRMWPKYEIPYLIGKSTGSMGNKQRAVPFVFMNNRLFYAPVFYDFNTEPMYEASSNTWVLNWDGTIKTPVTLTGYIDEIDSDSWFYRNQDPYSYDSEYTDYMPSYLKFQGSGASEDGKNTFTATIDLENYEPPTFPKNYHPLDTIKFGKILSVEKTIRGETHHLPLDLKVFELPCPQDPILSSISIRVGDNGALSLDEVKPTTSIQRLPRSGDYPNGGWHVVVDYDGNGKRLSTSFDIYCYKRSNTYVIKNSQLSYSAHYESEDVEMRYSTSGSMDESVQYDNVWSSNPSGRLGETFSIHGGLQGTYYEKYKNEQGKTKSLGFTIHLRFAY
jgi:hypothetical protein